MSLFVNTFFEDRVEQLFALANRVDTPFTAAGLEYRVVGGLAAYPYVEEAEPDAGRLTKDIDIVVQRADLERIAKAVEPYGLQYRHVAGLDMLVHADAPSRRKVNIEPSPELGSARRLQGIPVAAPLALVRRSLTRYRLEDRMSRRDLLDAAVITPEIERDLPEALRQRLEPVKASE